MDLCCCACSKQVGDTCLCLLATRSAVECIRVVLCFFQELSFASTFMSADVQCNALSVCVLWSFACIYHVDPGVSSGNFTIEVLLVLTCWERSGGFCLLCLLPVRFVFICAAWCLWFFVFSHAVRCDAKQHKCDHVSCL